MGPFTIETSQGFNKIRTLVDLHNPANAVFGSSAVYNPNNRPPIFDDETQSTFAYTLGKNVKGGVMKLPESTPGLVQIGSELTRFMMPRVVVMVPLKFSSRITDAPDTKYFETRTFLLPQEHMINDADAYAKAAVTLAVMAVADGVELTNGRH